MRHNGNHTSIIEEVFNAITHGLGVILGIVGTVILLVLAGKSPSPAKVIGFGIFGFIVTYCYLVSALYHSFSFTKAQKLFKILDHSSIPILIAGTYTPFMLIAFEERLGLILLSLVWILAIVGTLFKIFFIHKFRKLSLVFYVLMGWIALIGIKPLLSYLNTQTIYLLILGGVLYTGGIIFYSWKRLYFNHVIWHLFVLGGSISHFLAMLRL